MKQRLSWKLFVFTFSLCAGFLLLISVVQSLFFQQFYLASKRDSLREQAMAYNGTRESAQAIFQSEEIWIAELDSMGTISNLTGDCLTVQLDGMEDEVTIPLYAMVSTFGESPEENGQIFLSIGEEISLDVLETDDGLLPYMLTLQDFTLVNTTLADRLHGIHAEPDYASLTTRCYYGKIIDIDMPAQGSTLPFPFQEHNFLQQILNFQAELLRPNQKSLQVERQFTVTLNSVEYQIYVCPKNGGYVFSMVSLQPVGDAMDSLRPFTVIFFITALLLANMAAWVYSRWLARPLQQYSRVTRKMAYLDFSESLPVHSQDELGQLASNINSLSDQLKSHIDRLENELEQEKQLEQTRKTFISNVSHELKTPLAVMKSCLTILEDNIAPEKREHYFASLQSQIDGMTELVAEMLELSKMESGTYCLETEPFDLGNVLEVACRPFRDLCAENGVYLMIQAPTLTALGNGKLIVRVISNFLSNAVRHTPKGGTIRISTTVSDGTVTVRVENEGKPLPSEAQKHVFEQFYRVHPDKGGGSGLGLAICKAILELHRTTYGVENTRTGVCFFFALPTILPNT